jgi:hypothetical protein
MGTLTITTTPEQDARILDAFSQQAMLVDENGDPRQATAADVREWVVSQLKSYVRSAEEEVAKQNAVIAVSDLGDVT